MAKETTIRYGLSVGDEFGVDATSITVESIRRGRVTLCVVPSPPEVKKRPKRKKRN